ncbi:MAG TPA: hypothetical protein VE957_10260 [Terriglobales bacterium]|nr:hypothetical protein [Terriglobales bacterium]
MPPDFRKEVMNQQEMQFRSTQQHMEQYRQQEPHSGCSHHYINVPGCVMCEEREKSHAQGEFPHKLFHQGCVQCGNEATAKAVAAKN